MKILKRLLLIHWHYFNHEMIEFDNINFLTGKNSSGKSTILDAMQLVLLSDTSGSFFNKAASGKGNRTLTGYLRCELGDDEGSGFRYLRDGRFTSYIVLEFYDDIKKKYFSAGCCFDTFGENDCQKLFFRFDNSIPENELVEQKEPYNIDKLRSFIRTNYSTQSYTTNINRDFREDLCGKLGGLQTQRFCDLLKKASSFDPNVDIRKFITEFVCGDEQEINIADMKENIRSLDSLKDEAENLKKRIDLLTEINSYHNEFLKNKENETLYNYLIERAVLEIKENEIERYRQNIEKLINEINTYEEKLINAENEQKQLQAERDSLKLQLDSNEDARRLEELQKDIEEKKHQYNECKKEFERLSALLQNILSSWKTYINNFNNKISSYNLSVIDPLLQERIKTLCSEGSVLLEKAEPLNKAVAEIILENGKEKIKALALEADSFRDRCINLASRLHDAKDESNRRQLELKKEKESLEKGIYQFPKDAIDLKEAIESRLRSKYGANAKAHILAEAAEIRDDRWRNVIEGYLHTQKYYIIVEPEHFYTAFQLFDSIKRQKNIFTTGLVDTEKLQKMEPVRDEGSLAEELETVYPAVRWYINFVLGRVHKCDNIKDLRRNKTSITDDGVLYQNFVVRAMDPNRWRNPAIGQAGTKLRLKMVGEQITQLQQEVSVYTEIISALQGTDKFMRISEYETEQVILSAKQYLDLPEMEKTIQRLSADAESIDKNELQVLRQRLSERENALMEKGSLIRKISEDKGSAKKELQTYEESLPKLESEANVLRNALDVSYDKKWINENGMSRYAKEIAIRGSANEIYKAFPREQSRSQNAKENAWRTARDFRLKYNENYKTGYNIDALDNDVYGQIWQEYSEIKLPEYEIKIEDTRKKAFQQFQEDFLSKLQSNIRNTKMHIDELNVSMKSASFGEDTYQFRINANPEYKRYYDMIVDEMLLGGYNLMSEQFNNKYKEELKELFDIITNDGSSKSTHGYDDLEKRVQVFTDFKTYLHFDLEVIKPSGESERLSRTMGKKSGGETQTPFYIAVLASFFQLYRLGRDKIPNTTRLILFDEAFSKMDGERIIQSIDLLRRFKFQVVFAAPPDKIPDIAALVDRNLCVLRDGQKTCVRVFEPKQLEEFSDGN